MITRVSRLIEFARHIPVRKLARRAELDVRRRIGDHLGRRPAMSPGTPSRAGTPPSPLFAPRRSPMSMADDRLRFSFLHRIVEMPSGAIDWNAPSRAPADQLWRMNLHYMEYLEGADLALWQRLVAAWIGDNPQTQRGAWRDSWNSYALSLRVVVLMQELQRRGRELPRALVARVEASLAEQLRFLEHNLETDLGGNHLIKNIKALIWASCFFVGPEAERWSRMGLGLLDRELDHQVLADGMHDERSASYHAQVLADLLECRHALGGDPLGGRLDEALGRMAQVVADLAHPDGGPVLFNDAGLTMAYAPGECLAAYARLFGRRPKPRRVFALRAGGYYGHRSGDCCLVADCGRIAPDDLPAHGHGDLLSFEWSVAGRRVVVDQGVYEYAAGERRQRARAAASHNTLCFEGADQADFFGAFRCGRRPNPTVLGYTAHDDGFVLEGTHDGFRHLPGQPRHVRRFEVRAGAVRIDDRIDGGTGAPARIVFLLHPDVGVTVDGGAARLEIGAARVAMRATRPIAIESAVWWPDMGRELLTRRVVLALPSGLQQAKTELELLYAPRGASAA